MGTEVEVLAPPDRLDQAARITRALFERWERTLTRFDPASELSRLNRLAGNPTVVSDLLFEVVAASVAAARATGGVFDPTLLPQLLAAGYDRTFRAIPADRPAPPAPPRPGGAWREVELHASSRTVRLPAGAGLDLGGIAKGMAADAAVAELRAAGLAWAAVDAGGDVAFHGVPGGRPGWPVAVETGAGPDAELTFRSGGVATSTTANRRWRMGGRVSHHLIDPRTGAPAESGTLSVTVVAASCAEAEVAAKAALVMGEPAGTAFLDRLGLAGLVTREDGAGVASLAWPEAA